MEISFGSWKADVGKQISFRKKKKKKKKKKILGGIYQDQLARD
jgi:hypothetical protein